MNIVHISPFAPNLSGLYEASRDMAKADVLAGHQVFFIDAGIPNNGVLPPCQVGAVDERAGFRIETAHPDVINDADIIIMHGGFQDAALVKSQAPIIWMVHGKPLDAFRPESKGGRVSYTLYGDISQWQRVKKMIYFWPEYKPFWSPIFPENKHEVFYYPVIDEQRFCHEGEKHILENAGKYNILICDSVRDDIDLFELVIGCIETAKKYPNEFKFHFYGFNHPILDCWERIFAELKRVGGLGDLKPRFSNMENVYRAVDCVISPNRITNRVVAESLCCGVPVIQEVGGKMCDYSCYMPDPFDIVEVFEIFKEEYDNKLIDKQSIIDRSKVFNMANYSARMNQIYEEIKLK